VKARLARCRRVLVYYLSWGVFGSVGLALNVVCTFMRLLPDRESYAPRVRRTIRRLFVAWEGWLRSSQTVLVEWVGFGEEPLPGGTVYIANHPSLIDATLILSRLPDAVCIFKSSLMRNPAVGPAAVMAGYVPGDTGLDLMRAAAEKVAAGRSLLIFPEGTRTPEGTVVGRMKPGFALIADRARAPVRLLVIRSTGVGIKGRPWWPAPEVLPVRITVALDAVWPYEPGRPAGELTRAVETRICEVLGGPPPA
jgi:1-acyl-sn-glycerol-3-phosphate acyltransferase